jgi:hypothetical protein
MLLKITSTEDNIPRDGSMFNGKMKRAGLQFVVEWKETFLSAKCHF